MSNPQPTSVLCAVTIPMSNIKMNRPPSRCNVEGNCASEPIRYQDFSENKSHGGRKSNTNFLVISVASQGLLQASRAFAALKFCVIRALCSLVIPFVWMIGVWKTFSLFMSHGEKLNPFSLIDEREREKNQIVETGTS